MIADSEPLGQDRVTDSELCRIDQICDGFETVWKSERRPSIEGFLEGTAGLGCQLLLRELVLLDVQYRRRKGEFPRVAEYRNRFPDLDESWLNAELTAGLRDHAAAGGPGHSSESSTQNWSAKPPFAGDYEPRTFGKFQILEQVGVGAFGTVWRAVDVRLNRIVALKIPHAHLRETSCDIARFYGEARAAAQLRHPGIVTVHEVTDLNGLPVLVCDFVAGTSLQYLLAKGRLGRRESVKLVAKVADALAYAHSMGAIHRDIKPANIMLDAVADSGAGLVDAGSDWPGEPRIVDFGLASLEQESIHLTQEGAIIGTPAYMSPEQAVGRDSAHPIDHRTDIYSLGVVLYELLTGALPFAGTRSELLKKVIGSEPPSPRRLDRAIPRDLESICLKTIAKEPRHRYASARELADDLRCFLEGEPVRARPINLWQRVLRRAHRRPAEAALGLMGAVTLLAVFGLALGYRYHLRLEHEFRATDAARHTADQERKRAERFLYFHRMALAEREWSDNNIDRVERLLDDCPPPLREWEWHYLKGQCHHERLSMKHSPSATESYTVTCALFSPDGKAVASASRDGTIRLFDSATGRLIKLLGRHKHAAFSLAFHPEGRELASAGENGNIRIWDPRAGFLLRVLPTGTDTIYALSYSPDGRLLASGDGFPPYEEPSHMRGQGVVRIWDAATGQVLHTLRGHTQNVTGVDFSPDGRTLASVSGSWLTVPQTASKPGELFLWNTATFERIRKVTGHAGPLTGVRYHPGGNLIATSSWDRTIRLCDAATGDLRHTLAGHRDWVLHVAFSPDGGRIASSGADGAIKLWDSMSGRELWTLRGHNKNVTCVTFSPDGDRLASSSSDQTVRIWDATASPEAHTWRGAVGPIARITFFPDSHRLLVAGNIEDAPGRVRHCLTILDTAQGLREATFYVADDSGRGRPIAGIAIRRDGRLVASASQSGRIEAWSVPEARSRFRHDEPTSRFEDVAFSPDGRWLAAAGQVDVRLPSGEPAPQPDTDSNGLVLVFDLETGKVLWRAAGVSTGLIRDLAFSPDGQTLATANNSSAITIWDSQTGEIRRELRGHNRLVSYLAFSPDGAKLASASWDSTVVVWDLADSRAMTRLQGHMRSVLSVAFSPDGRRLATSSEDQTVRLWDVETGQEVLILRGHSDIVPTVAFSPDGNRLATAGADGIVLVREASPADGTGSASGRKRDKGRSISLVP